MKNPSAETVALRAAVDFLLSFVADHMVHHKVLLRWPTEYNRAKDVLSIYRDFKAETALVIAGLNESLGTFQWMPIHTAPKDRRILCWGPSFDEPCCLIWKTNPRNGDSYFGDPTESDDYEMARPEGAATHWIELPPLPLIGIR